MRRSAALVIGLGLLVLSAANAQAAEPHTVCSATNPLPPGTYGNVTAEHGCRLNETHLVQGWLYLYGNGGDGGLLEVDGTRIGGDLVIDGEGEVDGAQIGGGAFFLGGYASGIRNSSVGDAIWTASGFGAMYVVGNTIGGDVILDGAGSDEVIASDNVIEGDFLVSRIGGNFSLDRNQVAGNFRVTDASPYNTGPSTISGNQVGGHFEVARVQVTVFPETPVGLEPSVVVSDNVVGGHVGLFENGIWFYGGGAERDDLDGVRFTGNRLAGALLCRSNRDLVAEDNEALSLLGQCRSAGR